ncbi:MAG: hypothetical protein GC159_16330 [Phycisphaera sp.]|nr:hypothetical protein [Phycisphaera sp.]
MRQNADINDEALYVSPKILAARWSCARSTVSRIARRERFRTLFLGHGRNGGVRYHREDVIAFERSREMRLSE